jgi:hypothetical protein
MHDERCCPPLLCAHVYVSHRNRGEIFGVSYTTIAFGLVLILFPGVVFGALNAILVLALLAPLVLTVGLNLFVKANTVSGARLITPR